MANLMITTACNFNCDYCFGLEMIGPTHRKEMMTWETFLSILDWIYRRQIPDLQIHLMGGEPTLHPLIADMIKEIYRRGSKMVIFSNASAVSDMNLLDTAVSAGVRWIVNTNNPKTYRGNQLDILQKNLSVLGPAAGLTFNITSSETPYDHIFDYIERFNLQKYLKIGVALPTMRHQNVYAKREDFDAIGSHIMKIHDIAEKKGISLEFECGVPYCLFTPAQREKLKIEKISHCGSRLDITPWGEVIYCLPLSNAIKVPYSEFSDYRMAREWFSQALHPYRAVGGSDECLTCEHIQSTECMACLSYSLSQYNSIKFPPIPDKKLYENK